MKIGTKIIRAAIPSINIPRMRRNIFTSNRKIIVLSEMDTIQDAIVCGTCSKASIQPKIFAIAISIVITAVVETVLIKILGIDESLSSR